MISFFVDVGIRNLVRQVNNLLFFLDTLVIVLLARATAVVGISHMARDCNQGGRRCGGMHGNGGGSGSATTMGILGTLQGTSKQAL
ncbi:hypothetical protein AHAS_Ahas16G0114700 [Arachis hypogaea]